MFFVVDFETSDLNPWRGEILTLGAVAVTEQGEINTENVYYERAQHNARDPRTAKYPTPTQEFWAAQNEDVLIEAFSQDVPRIDLDNLASSFVAWMDQFEPDPMKRYIVANPIAFDKMWLEFLFRNYPNPVFHYRCLCLRSMRYGIEYGRDSTFGSSRDRESEMKHHALFDAIAEAMDLKDLMENATNQYNLANIGANHIIDVNDTSSDEPTD